jgi:thioredoxin-related protein
VRRVIRSCYTRGRAVLALSLLAAAALPAAGQEVRWHADYRTAWEESRAARRPLVLDFGTQRCFWCKKLDATTFRDPAVAGRINAEFVALRVDARSEPDLARALHVEAFPTVVFAGPDGRVLGRVVGYADPAAFLGHLQRALARLPEPASQAKDYEEASAAIAVPDYPRAIALLRRVVGDGGSRPVQVRARLLLEEFEQEAAGRLRRVKELRQQGQLAEANAALADLVRTFDGTDAAREAGQLLSARAR